MAARLLTKSRYLNGLQCPKYLWYVFHEPDRIPPTDEATQYTFDQGNEVGEVAREAFPGGVIVPPDDFMGNIRQTRALMARRQTVFEAGIMSGNLYCRVDILAPSGVSAWDIIEVKSATRIKDINIDDVAFQKYCCEQAGLEINNCYLMHINNQYVRHGDIDPQGLFETEDITGRVSELYGRVPENVEALFGVIRSQTCPEVNIGVHCSSPYDCPVEGCRDFLPESNVLELHRGGRTSYELLDEGILAIGEIPDEYALSERQEIQRDCVTTGQPCIDSEHLQEFLDSLVYPLYYLDFETFAPAIPRFEGTHPYQNIVFQFSLHVVREEGAEAEHYSHLARGTDDPRHGVLVALSELLGDSGTIIVYNQSFEKSVLNGLAEAWPEYAERVAGVLERFVDLYQPFRKFWYYHPAQKGSASLKAVLPALTGNGYGELNIAGGEMASIEYQRVTYGDVPEEERHRIYADLETYCGLDTEGMVWIVEALRNAV